MDGKWFCVRKPPNSGSEYYDYKLHHSIIMLAIVDAQYNILYVDVGNQGRASDAGVWDHYSLTKYLQENKLQVPDSTVLLFTTSKSSYVLVGDDAFPLKTFLVKPYAGKDVPMPEKNFQLFAYTMCC